MKSLDKSRKARKIYRVSDWMLVRMLDPMSKRPDRYLSLSGAASPSKNQPFEVINSGDSDYGGDSYGRSRWRPRAFVPPCEGAHHHPHRCERARNHHRLDCHCLAARSVTLG